MGLFSRKHSEPRRHLEAMRIITVPAPIDAVTSQIESYGSLHSAKHATEHQLVLSASAGGTTIELPPRIHPWTFHNLGFWLLDTPGGGQEAVLHSSATTDHPAYTLVRDPDLGDCLCGVDDNGDGWTVSVPTNEIVRPAPVPATGSPLPQSHPDERKVVSVLMEDPGHDLNPANASTVPTRRRLSEITMSVVDGF